jgi:predicted MPP superfamily phosphohydrolase
VSALTPDPSPGTGEGHRRPSRRVLSVVAVFCVLAVLAADAFYWEPKVRLRHDTLALLPGGPALRLVHLSDLHVRGDAPNLRRLLAEVAAARPDAILISGDLIGDSPDPAVLAPRLRAARAFYAALRRTAPVLAIQGHSEYQGDTLTALASAGVEWLFNEGRVLGPDARGRRLLLLGLSQQVGTDAQGWRWRAPFRALAVDGQPVYGARRGTPFLNFYSHYDPAPQGLADGSGPLAWSGTDLTVETRIDDAEAGSGIEVHSRYVLGEDRMIRLRRVRAEHGGPGSFALLLHGSSWTGASGEMHLDTGVDPRPHVWYRLRLRTEVTAGAVVARARVWPAGEPEPGAWQAWGEDRSPSRVTAGTVGLWAWGGGDVFYRNLRVTDAAGHLLLADPLHGVPAGFRQGARGTRLALALARSPRVPPGTPRLVLSHVPEVALEASRRGLETVLAGHTHGGQVRLPILGPLTTRSSLGPSYDRGVFRFAAPNRQGWTTLYVNPGVGTSILPVRFLCPPTWALVTLGRSRGA